MAVAAVLSEEAQNQTHHKHGQIQTIGGCQRGMNTTVSHNRASDHESQHGADGAQVRMKFTSFGEDTLVCSEPNVIKVV